MCITTSLVVLMATILPLHGPLTDHLARKLAVSIAVTERIQGAATYPDVLASIYRVRGDDPLWIGREDAAATIAALIALFADASSHGLDPGRYAIDHLRLLSDDWPSRPVTDQAILDAWLTDTAVAYVTDLAGQRQHMPMPPTATASNAARCDVAAFVVRAATATDTPAAHLEAAAPASAEYAALRGALRRLRAVEASGGWPLVPAGPTLHPGACDQRVPLLRKRLDAGADMSEVYDDAMADAVCRAQVRLGLAADGIVGRQTLAALNTPVSVRRHQLEFSLERLRCLPRDLGARYVRVDVLANRLSVVEGDSVVLQMRTVVGKPERPTPALSSRITSVDVNPCWNIPQKLAREDLLPRVRRDPGYLRAHAIRVFADWRPDAPQIDPSAIDWAHLEAEDLPYKLQQAPGPENALGRVKFMFANAFAVYIHDTPHREKFALRERFYSSGCVRVEEPLDLARTLLGAQYRRFTDALDSGESITLGLARPVNVHLVYLTAWPDATGEPCFRDDIYGYDTSVASWDAYAAADAPSPAAHGAGVDVHEVGAGVIAHTASPQP